jgi:hypothetical protein
MMPPAAHSVEALQPEAQGVHGLVAGRTRWLFAMRFELLAQR